jgi:hypothetical protein
MNVTSLKALVALITACILFSGSVVLFVRGKSSYSFLQLVGAECLVVVVLTHVRSTPPVSLDALGFRA